MEAYSNPGLRLKFHIHLAAFTILLEHIYTKFATAIRIALALYFGNLPAKISCLDPLPGSAWCEPLRSGMSNQTESKAPVYAS